jgi:hypothetical protein
MTQTWTDNVYEAGHVAATDLQNMENNFASLKSMFLGASSPASMAAGHPWFDSAKHVLKIRNDANSAWWGLMHADTSQKIWVYRDSAMNGWAIDSSVTDRVLALKGGSNAYNRTGGGTGGTWTQPDHTHSGSTGSAGSHNHKWYDYYGDSHDRTYNSDGSLVDVSFSVKPAYARGLGRGEEYGLDDAWTSNASSHTHSLSTNGNATANTWRPAAAVGTLQYMDL